MLSFCLPELRVIFGFLCFRNHFATTYFQQLSAIFAPTSNSAARGRSQREPITSAGRQGGQRETGVGQATRGRETKNRRPTFQVNPNPELYFRQDRFFVFRKNGIMSDSLTF